MKPCSQPILRRRDFVPALAGLALPAAARAAESPLACNLKALTAQERALHKERSQRLFAAAKIKPIDAGYAVRLPADLWTEAAAWVELERKCCPFLRFQLESAAEGAGVVLRLTGRTGVKEFLQLELGLKR
jgi:hypothetical protein